MSFVLSRHLTEARQGDVVSVGYSQAPGLDLYELTSPGGFTINVKRLGIGDSIPNTSWPVGVFVTFQNYVEVQNIGTTNVVIRPEADIQGIWSLILEPLGFTGGTPVGSSIPKGALIETVNANEAGEIENVGSSVNGDIYAVVPLGEFAYILKKRSIQSIQSVGIGAGTFFLRPEILDEGVVGRYAWCRCSDREIAFIGHKNIYVYGGGQNLRAVGQQHWYAFAAEVDWARADEIVAHHNRHRNEVWFSYPVTGGLGPRVLIWNYVEDSIVIDKYPEAMSAITAIGRIDWELAPTWDSLSLTEKCTDSAKRWYDYVDVAEDEYALIGIEGDTGNPVIGESENQTYPRLLLHGRVWSRSSSDECELSAIPSLVETPDFDFGDPSVWKYIDTVYLALYGRSNVAAGSTLSVSVGARDNLLSPLRWSPPQSISVVEASAAPTKINTTMSGRYLRLRFQSNHVGANWGISSYHIIGRRGGTY